MDDVGKVRSLLRQLQLSRPQCELKERSAALQAKQVLERNAEAYGALRTAMAERQPLEVCIQAAVQANLEQPLTLS